LQRNDSKNMHFLITQRIQGCNTLFSATAIPVHQGQNYQKLCICKLINLQLASVRIQLGLGVAAMDSFMGTIMGWAPNFAPQGWAFCQGQTLSIQQNTAMFSLLGVVYGGNGTTTFGLPNLGGRVPVGAGQSGGTGQYILGQTSGTETVTLSVAQMPAHTHAGAGLSVALGASTSPATSSAPGADAILAAPNGATDGGETVIVRAYAPSSTQNTTLHGGGVSGAVAPAGGSMPFGIMQPYQAINFIICLQGLFPPRP
jgi:microcystin-dependent protein